MPQRFRCPTCKAVFPAAAEGAGPPPKCPACGKRLAAAAKPKPPAPEEEKSAPVAVRPEEPPPAADAKPPKDAPPRRRKRRRPAQPQSKGWGLLSWGYAAGAALLLLGVSYGFSAVVRFAIDRGESLAPAPPPGPQVGPAVPPGFVVPPAPTGPDRTPQSAREPDKAPAWQAKADPSPGRAAPAVPADACVPFNGDPLIAWGDVRLFAIDTPQRGPNPNPDLQGKEGDWVPVLDLGLYQGNGLMAKAAPRGYLSALSPNGEYLVCLARVGKVSKPKHLEVWKVARDDPVAELEPPGTVLWMAFVNADTLAVGCHGKGGLRLQLWSVSKGQVEREIPLPPEVFPPPDKAPGASTFAGAISPGQQVLAAGGPFGIALLSLADGRHLGTLPLAEGKERVTHRGMRFSDDGAELSGVFAFDRPDGKRVVRLKGWKMADGSPSVDVELANEWAFGPPLRGPKPGTAFLGWVQSMQGRFMPYGQVIDTGTGATVSETPYMPVGWLNDGRLLVVGLAGRLPPGTPPPKPIPADPTAPEAELRQWEERLKKDPDVRIVYTVAFDREK
jgi:hypothetical protein